MRKYILALIFITLCVVISHGQKRRDNNAKEKTVYRDPCLIPAKEEFTPPFVFNTNKDPRCVIPGTVSAPTSMPNLRFSNPRGYPIPVLSIKIKLAHAYISNLNDLKFTMEMANNTYHKQTFLFDRHTSTGTFLFGAYCYITNSKNQSIVKYANKAVFDSINYYKKLDSYYYTLEPSEWLVKQFAVKDLVVLDSTICKKGKIPRDKYTLRLVFQNNYSNEVEFTTE